MNIVLLIHGKAYAGKDTFFGLLQSIFPEYAKKIAFADEVKREYCVENNLDYNRMQTDNIFKAQHRKGLVELGDGRRKSSPNYWVIKHREMMFPYLETHDRRIIGITDTRYLNEIEDYPKEIKSYFNKKVMIFKIKIHANLITRLSRMSGKGVIEYMEHAHKNRSENDLNVYNEFDHHVDNNENYTSYIDILKTKEDKFIDVIRSIINVID